MKLLLPLALAALLLAGCASTPEIQAPQQFAATHGYVVATFEHEFSGGALYLKSADGKEHQLLLRPGTTAFGKWLPAGQYRIASWGQKEWGSYTPIQVRAGRVTDLGGFAEVSMGGYEYAILPLRNTDTAAAANAAVQELRPHLAAPEILAWAPTQPPPLFQIPAPSTNLGIVGDALMAYDRHVNEPALNGLLRQATTLQEFSRLARLATPPKTTEPGSDGQGNLYYGAEIGQLRVRSAAGKWSSFDTGGIHEVTAVEAFGAWLYAGSARGVIRRSDKRGASWTVLASLGADQAVIDIDRVGQQWIVATAKLEPVMGHMDARELKVYAATREDLSDLALIHQSPVSSNNLMRGVVGESWGNYYYAGALPDLLRYDTTTRQWSKVTPPTDINGFHVSPANGTVAAYKAMGVFSKLFVSANHGQAWTRRGTPPIAIQEILFTAADSGIAVRSDIGTFSVTNQIMQYNAASDGWTRTSDMPAGCQRFLRDARNEPRFCVTTGSNVFANDRSRWVLEFGVE